MHWLFIVPFVLVTIFDIYALFLKTFSLVLVTGGSCGNIRVYFLFLFLYTLFYMQSLNLYKPKRFQNRTSEYANLIKANSIGMVFFFIYIIFMKIPHVSRSLQLMFYVLSMLLTIAERAAIRYALERTRRKGFNLKHVVVIGFSAAAEATSTVLSQTHSGATPFTVFSM